MPRESPLFISTYFLPILILILANIIQTKDEKMKIIVLPFKTLAPKNVDSGSPINITSLVENRIFTEINMTSQTLIAFFNSEEYAFIMTSENCPEFSNYYIKNSPSFTNLSQGYASERMILYRDYDLKTKEYGYYSKMEVKEYNDKKQCAILGLKMNLPVYEYDRIQNFVKTFYVNENINSYQWTVKYTKDNEGLVIIGDSPLNYDPMFKNKKYEEHQTQAIGESTTVDFGIDFNDITFGSKDFEIKHAHFNHDLGVLLVNKIIYEKIKDSFFVNYLGDKKICFEGWVYEKYGYIYCDSNKFTDSDIKSLPKLIFKQTNMNYIFELNYEDLFSKQKDGRIYFLIVFDLNYKTFKIGKPFLKKYSLTVDNKKNLITYFRIKEENEDNGYSRIVWIVILSVFVVILAGTTGFFAYKFIKKKNKKRANELDEDYEYLGKENSGKNSENKNGENSINGLGV
jgi:hypothetical protein